MVDAFFHETADCLRDDLIKSLRVLRLSVRHLNGKIRLRNLRFQRRRHVLADSRVHQRLRHRRGIRHEKRVGQNAHRRPRQPVARVTDDHAQREICLFLRVLLGAHRVLRRDALHRVEPRLLFQRRVDLQPRKI